MLNWSPCIIAGDINIDLCKISSNNKTADYVSNLLLNNFFPAVIVPTRFSSRCATLIDHIYYYEGKPANRSNTEVHSGNFIHDLTDHLPNYLLLGPGCQPKVGILDLLLAMFMVCPMSDVCWSRR